VLGVNVDANGSANQPTTQTPLFTPYNRSQSPLSSFPSAAGHGGPGQVRAGEPHDANFGRPEKRKAATMQIRLTRTANESRTGHMKIVRVPSTVHAVSRLHHIFLPSRPQSKVNPGQEPQSASVAPADYTSAARARRALWKIRRLFKDASRAAKGQVRVRRAATDGLLGHAPAGSSSPTSWRHSQRVWPVD
jgi:hypothetical protein